MCKKRKMHSYCKTGRQSSNRAETALKTPKTRKEGFFTPPVFRITCIIRKYNNQKNQTLLSLPAAGSEISEGLTDQLLL